MHLKSEQRRLYELLTEKTRCFVRVCDDDKALWVSDLPRKCDGFCDLQARLHEEGFDVNLDENAKLWYIDWTEERWQKMLATLPGEPPALPLQDEYHEAYALCRLWMLHAAPLDGRHMPTLRRLVKLTADQPAKLLRAVRALHEEAAVRLRSGETMPCAAGRLLAAWLARHAYGKELQP